LYSNPEGYLEFKRMVLLGDRTTEEKGKIVRDR